MFVVAWGRFIFYCNSKFGEVGKCVTADIEVLQFKFRKINFKNRKRIVILESLIISYVTIG